MENKYLAYLNRFYFSLNKGKSYSLLIVTKGFYHDFSSYIHTIFTKLKTIIISKIKLEDSEKKKDVMCYRNVF